MEGSNRCPPENWAGICIFYLPSDSIFRIVVELEKLRVMVLVAQASTCVAIRDSEILCRARLQAVPQDA
jgi:hypothetical protein